MPDCWLYKIMIIEDVLSNPWNHCIFHMINEIGVIVESNDTKFITMMKLFANACGVGAGDMRTSQVDTTACAPWHNVIHIMRSKTFIRFDYGTQGLSWCHLMLSIKSCWSPMGDSSNICVHDSSKSLYHCNTILQLFVLKVCGWTRAVACKQFAHALATCTFASRPCYCYFRLNCWNVLQT